MCGSSYRSIFGGFPAERKAHAPLEASGEGSLGVGVHLTKNRL